VILARFKVELRSPDISEQDEDERAVSEIADWVFEPPVLPVENADDYRIEINRELIG